MIQLTLTLKMTTAQVVETSVTVNDNSPIQDYVNPDDQTQPTKFKVEENSRTSQDCANPDCAFINPSSPKSDQQQISPCDINAL